MPGIVRGEIITPHKLPLNEVILPDEVMGINIPSADGQCTTFIFECDKRDTLTSIYLCEELPRPLSGRDELSLALRYENLLVQIGNNQEVTLEFDDDPSTPFTGRMTMKHFVALGRVAI